MTADKDTAISKKDKRKQAWKSLPDVWALIHPRRRLLIGGLALMAVNRVCGLVLPASSKYIFDNVVTKRQENLLLPIIGTILAATIIQGLTSFTLTQLLSNDHRPAPTSASAHREAAGGRFTMRIRPAFWFRAS
jgi:ABC-type bacteriocin/lantibiotic exporter with double-glycine peptidase domain